MNLAEFQREIDERNAAELARLKWDTEIVKKIIAAGWPVNTWPVKRFKPAK